MILISLIELSTKIFGGIKIELVSNHDVIYYAPGDKLANSIKECEEWNAQDCK